MAVFKLIFISIFSGSKNKFFCSNETMKFALLLLEVISLSNKKNRFVLKNFLLIHFVLGKSFDEFLISMKKRKKFVSVLMKK